MKKNNIGYLLREGFRGVFLHGFMSFAAICVTVACLIIMGSFCLILYNTSAMVKDLEQKNEMLVYIDESYSEAKAKSVGSQINLISNVHEAKFVSRQQALDEFVATQNDAELFAGIEADTLRDRFGDKVSVNLLFDGGLANLVYAASDLYLMPSKSEPCGLSQLIAMRMGSVPVVNATGGLKDTVWPYSEADETGRGFTFQSYNADDFLAAIDRALALYYNEPEKWLRLAENDMAVDSSWDVPAQKYMALFQNVCGQ